MKAFFNMLYEKVYNFIFYYLIPDSWEIRYRFKKKVGYRCNLRSPKSFNEKIQWLKLHDRNPLYTKLIDKIQVKSFVAKVLGDDYVIPMIGQGYSHFDDIPFDELPDKFVIKCNHDAASFIVCKDKSTFDFKAAKDKIEKALKVNYYHFVGKQWGYKYIKPQVFVEKYMSDANGELPDYKFMMFNGTCKCIFTCFERGSHHAMKMNFYDPQWRLLPFTRIYHNTDTKIPKPENFDKMLDVANHLAAAINVPFVRIDLYNVNNRIYFGEYTFYPGGGLEAFTPVEWDYILGSWLDLNVKKQ